MWSNSFKVTKSEHFKIDRDKEDFITLYDVEINLVAVSQEDYAMLRGLMTTQFGIELP